MACVLSPAAKIEIVWFMPYAKCGEFDRGELAYLSLLAEYGVDGVQLKNSSSSEGKDNRSPSEVSSGDPISSRAISSVSDNDRSACWSNRSIFISKLTSNYLHRSRCYGV